MEAFRVNFPGPLIALALAFSAGGCQSGLYDWGTYDTSVSALYAPSGVQSGDVGKQIQELQAEIHKTETGAKANVASRVPPGKYAHLGYLYAMQGDKGESRRCFEAEKRLYPESARFVDGMMGRLQ